MFFYKSDEFKPRKYRVSWTDEDDFGRWYELGIVGFLNGTLHKATLLVLGEKPCVQKGDWVSFDEVDGVSVEKFTRRDGTFDATLNIKVNAGKLRVYPKKTPLNRYNQ